MRKTERAKLTPEAFRASLLEIARDNPRRKNAVSDDSSCLYTDEDGRHCLIGEFLALHDPRALPKFGSRDNAQSADRVLEALGYSREVADLANSVQIEADGCHLTWRQSILLAAP
jgi:hypothetical protein